jgi:hypothetical protein
LRNRFLGPGKRFRETILLGIPWHSQANR